MTRLPIVIVKVMMLYQYCTGPKENIYLPLKIIMQIKIGIDEKAPQNILLHKKEKGYTLVFQSEVSSCQICNCLQICTCVEQSYCY